MNQEALIAYLVSLASSIGMIDQMPLEDRSTEYVLINLQRCVDAAIEHSDSEEDAVSIRRMHETVLGFLDEKFPPDKKRAK